MESKEKTIAELNKLIEINNDRIEGYETAAKETDDNTLKSLFASMGDESRAHRSELISEVIGLGGIPAEGTTTSGKVFRAWMDIKSALSGKNRHAIIGSCETGEDAALETYDDVLGHRDDLNTHAQNVISNQREKIQRSHDRIKMMRDTADTK